MRWIVWFGVLFAAAVVAALTFGDNDGLVSFYWNGWRIDVSLNLFLLGALALGLVGAYAASAIDALLHFPVRAREWRELNHERAAQAALREAVAELLAGRYGRAGKAVRRALALRARAPALRDDAAFDALAHLISASSLHRMQSRGPRDAELARALPAPAAGGAPRTAGAVDDAARLLALEWAIDDRDAERAQVLLAELPPGVARRTLALRLRLQAQRLARQPLQALQTARLLANHQGFSETAARSLLRALAIEAIDAAHDAEQLRATWLRIDAADQGDAVVAARAALAASRLDAGADARAWLRPLWDRLDALDLADREALALALAGSTRGIGNEWLAAVEHAQRRHATEPAVQAAAGMVYAERGLWGKARGPLEQAAASATLDPQARRACWRTLAELAHAQGDEARAAQCLAAAASAA